MLILSRKVGQPVLIGNDLIVTPQRIDGDRVKLGFAARDRGLLITRMEVALAMLAGRRNKLDANEFVDRLGTFQTDDAIADLFARLAQTPLHSNTLATTA